MKANIGLRDRAIRLFLGVIVAGVFISQNSAWALLGIPVFVTGVVGICPLYGLLGVTTFGKEDKELV